MSENGNAYKLFCALLSHELLWEFSHDLMRHGIRLPFSCVFFLSFVRSQFESLSCVRHIYWHAFRLTRHFETNIEFRTRGQFFLFSVFGFVNRSCATITHDKLFFNRKLGRYLLLFANSSKTKHRLLFFVLFLSHLSSFFVIFRIRRGKSVGWTVFLFVS